MLYWSRVVPLGTFLEVQENNLSTIFRFAFMEIYMQQQTDQLLDKIKKLAEKRTKLDYKERQLREKSRKQEIRKLIEIGNMASKCGIADFDKETLMGAFSEVMERSQLPDIKNEWKKKGSILSETSLTPLLVSFKKDPNEELLRTLKDKRFKWNNFRKEWQGYGVEEEIAKLVKESHGKVEVVRG